MRCCSNAFSASPISARGQQQQQQQQHSTASATRSPGLGSAAGGRCSCQHDWSKGPAVCARRNNVFVRDSAAREAESAHTPTHPPLANASDSCCLFLTSACKAATCCCRPATLPCTQAGGHTHVRVSHNKLNCGEHIKLDVLVVRKAPAGCADFCVLLARAAAQRVRCVHSLVLTCRVAASATAASSCLRRSASVADAAVSCCCNPSPCVSHPHTSTQAAARPQTASNTRSGSTLRRNYTTKHAAT